jgi:class 3 adenylate cyclase
MVDASRRTDAGGAQGVERAEPPSQANARADGDATESGHGALLRYRDDVGAERCHRLASDGLVTIGRGEGADVSLPWDRSVSSVHAQAVKVGEHWLIADEGVSRNGTFVNGERVSGRRRLRDDDVIRVGRTTLVFCDAGDERRSETTVIEGMSVLRTVTLLFTDLVGSTELMGRLGDDMADRVQREHFATLRRASRAHDGTVVKSLGDGLMLSFQSALGAVACAAAMQQRIAAYNEAAAGATMALRIGLNAGEVISADGDYFGTPVVVASRLCDAAQAGQVLLSDLVRTLVGDRGGHRFSPLGPVSLKGLSEPVSVFQLDWAGAGAVAKTTAATDAG